MATALPKHPDHLRPVEADNGHEPGPAAGPDTDAVEQWTDLYFMKTKAVVEKFGDAQVVYAVFMRRPVISAPRLAIDWLKTMATERGTEFKIDLRYDEGRWVGAGEPLMYISGSLIHLSDLETILLQKLGPACVAAFNAEPSKHEHRETDGFDDGGRLQESAEASSLIPVNCPLPTSPTPIARPAGTAWELGVGSWDSESAWSSGGEFDLRSPPARGSTSCPRSARGTVCGSPRRSPPLP